MKKIIIVLLVMVVTATQAVASNELKTNQERFGYAIGMNIGTSMMLQQLDISPEQLAAGFVDAFKGEKTLLTVAEMKQVLTEFQQVMEQKQAAESTKILAENEKIGQKYLVANGAKEGVVTLESGLQYKVLKGGTGAHPNADSTVEVHYRGTTIDGNEFDSSYKRNKPATFPVKGVIAGWTEALQLMKEGAKWQLVIPASLAYGEHGAPPNIQPNSTLIFEVELLKVL